MTLGMKAPNHTTALFLLLLASASGGQPTANHELLVKPDTLTIDSVVARNEAEILGAHSKAKLGKFGLFTFNLELLEAKEDSFTVTLFGELPATIASFGIHREPDSDSLSVFGLAKLKAQMIEQPTHSNWALPHGQWMKMLNCR